MATTTTDSKFFWNTPRKGQGQIVQTHLPQMKGAAEGTGPAEGCLQLVTDASDQTWDLYGRNTRRKGWEKLGGGKNPFPTVDQALALWKARFHG